MNDQVQADYDQLGQIADRFASQSQAIAEMLQTVRNSFGNLEGEWIGEGSDAFFDEMESLILPSTERLREALAEASQTSKFIVQTMQDAEEDAGSPFKI